MKKLSCSICGRIHSVDDKTETVICGDCLIAGEPPLKIEGKVVYWRKEAFSRLLELKVEKNILEEKFKKLREENVSFSSARERLGLSYRDALIFEARRLRKEGLGFRKIAKKIGVSHMTVKRWCDKK